MIAPDLAPAIVTACRAASSMRGCVARRSFVRPGKARPAPISLAIFRASGSSLETTTASTRPCLLRGLNGPGDAWATGDHGRVLSRAALAAATRENNGEHGGVRSWGRFMMPCLIGSAGAPVVGCAPRCDPGSLPGFRRRGCQERPACHRSHRRLRRIMSVLDFRARQDTGGQPAAGRSARPGRRSGSASMQHAPAVHDPAVVAVPRRFPYVASQRVTRGTIHGVGAAPEPLWRAPDHPLEGLRAPARVSPAPLSRTLMTSGARLDDGPWRGRARRAAPS